MVSDASFGDAAGAVAEVGIASGDEVWEVEDIAVWRPGLQRSAPRKERGSGKQEERGESTPRGEERTARG